MGADTKLIVVWWMLLGFLVRCCWGAGLCGLEIQQQNKLYKFNLASPLRDYPHGVLSEDGFYKISQNDSETGTETKFWFQLCEQMVFNHDQPVCFRCQPCGGPLHCGLTCSALMAKNIAGYYICTTLGRAANLKVSLIDMKSPGKGVRLNMSASTTDGDCSLSVSVYCNANGVQAPMSVSKSGKCNYVTTMMHPAGCPAVTSIGAKGLGWLNTLIIVIFADGYCVSIFCAWNPWQRGDSKFRFLAECTKKNSERIGVHFDQDCGNLLPSSIWSLHASLMIWCYIFEAYCLLFSVQII